MRITIRSIGLITIIFFINLVIKAQTQLAFTPSMIVNVNSDTPISIADEQESTNPFTKWETSWDPDFPFPHYAIIDFNDEVTLSNISIYDMNGEGNLIVEKKVGSDWIVIFTDPLNNYLTWNNHPVSVTTQKIRLIKTDGDSIIGEVKFFGSSSVNEEIILSDLLVDGNTINGFSPSITNYNIQLPEGSDVPTVTVVLNDPNSNVSISSATDIPGITTITITSQDGSATMVYFIHFTIVSVDNVNYIHLNEERDEWMDTPIFNAYESGDFDVFWYNKLNALPQANSLWDGGNIDIGGGVNGVGDIVWNDATVINKKPLLVVLPSANSEANVDCCPSEYDFIVSSAIHQNFEENSPQDHIEAVLAIQQMIKNILASGKCDGRVFVMGKSQGGGLSLITTALSNSVLETYVSVPAMTGYTGEGGYNGSWPGNNPDDFNANYIDACNHAKRITTPVTFSLGFNDDVTWYRGQNTAAKNIPSGTVYLYHNTDGHLDLSWWNQGVQWLADVLERNSNIVGDITVTIHFDSSPTNVTIQKATLKYNKDFAYSFTLDDGIASQYTNAYPILSGVGDESGCFYTDGCGNDISFEAGLAINAAMINENGGYYLTWDNIETLFNNGWGVMNHSYTHAAFDENIDYNFEITQNNLEVQNRLNFEMTHFVIPSGDENYINPAFNNGMSTVYNQSFTEDWQINPILQVDGNILSNSFKRARKWVGDDDFSNTLIDNTANLSNNDNHYWYNDFAHIITDDGDFPINDFSNYMHYIDNSYGKNGSDRVWMSSLQEVYEYIAIRETATLFTTISGNDLQVSIDLSSIPDNLYNTALTLKIDSNLDFSSLDVIGANAYTFNGTGTNKIINLEWSDNVLHTSSNTIGNAFDVKIFPNPATDILRVISKKKLSKIKIFNQFGKIISIDKQNLNQIDLTHLSKGIYVMKITDIDGNSWTKKLIKK